MRCRPGRSASLTLGALLALSWAAPREQPLAAHSDGRWVRGVTVSTHGGGQEWFGAAFAAELDRLAELGANWVAIHPYGRIAADGRVDGGRHAELGGEEGLAGPIAAAHARGLSILIVPHLAHWGSPFSWRGAIDFAPGPERERFFATYSAWILGLVESARGADGFVLGSELDRLVDADAAWRALIAAARERTAAHLTYAANWDSAERVGFWDALDAVGVQAYYPLSDSAQPTRAELYAGWSGVVARLRALHERTGKPVVLTELGYDASLDAAREPWKDGRRQEPAELEAGRALQLQCLEAAFAALQPEREWLRGAFLWKWFVGGARREDFRLDSQQVRALLQRSWSPARER